MRTIDWVDGAVEIIDQTALPEDLRVLRLHTVGELIAAIQALAVRGAPALGVAGAFGVALAARVHADDPAALAQAVHRIETARPTAVNLARGARRAARLLPAGPAAVLAEACAIRDEEVAASEAMAALGADLVAELCGARPRLLTHCNTGGLATVATGTALGVIGELHRRDALGAVIASETRPLLQGARLTSWELSRWGVRHRVAVDSAGPFLMARGEVDAVILGADRICANGDVINKIGSYSHALGARRAGIPFLVVAPESTVDPDTPTGAHVEIEDRGAAEVTAWSDAVNPAFDITPSDLVTAIVTDRRVIRVDRGETPAAPSFSPPSTRA
ncbi:S-methyl-5-thioribose-1-phosphate isomerase [Actinoplanes teichomyceticus]|uniref:Methylthioribose-1-phosphate isomerase n=1 Tax=Actinoplanes teichomyceticus TaxID=1867 RepID=A0A561WQR6_ACTTI|nr:S-methyl-5-thioribose-1-phosphate isomerase [Actinoplanes teichomyceticus]TWG26210.1 methylthioribose-1-phosphate isomerase [Actinoplanes teichomyceticus]GIF11289.1 methylthioribose-1-phosphate isomerase [Actinoplanes teichomyceticus]